MIRQLWRALAAFALVAVASAGLGSVARAEIWVPAARGAAGDLFEVDAGSASRNGPIEQTWVKQTLARPTRDANARKSYVTELDQRFDDCQNRRFQIGEVTRRDAQGRVVSTGSAGMSWQDIKPESVAEAVWRVACRIGDQLPEKPLLDNISEGDWIRIGMSADRKYYFSVRFDSGVKLDQDHVLSLSRSDYVDFDLLHGYPIKYVVTANIVDCAQSKTAMFGMDTYMTADVRAESYRAQASSLAFEPVAPGSFMANSIRQICAQAAPPSRDQEGGDSDAGEVVSGTAWGVSKGYLVTASHVIKGAKRIAVYADGQPIGSAVVAVDDPANDVAILKLTVAQASPLVVLPLSAHGATLGKSVFTLGYPEPDTLGQHVKMTAGVVSATSGLEDDARLLQISVPIQPGNSGGPIIGWDGEVVGVADSSIQKFDDAQAQNVNYAVKASYVRAMLEDLPDLGGYVLVKPAASHDDMVTAARKAVFMLVVTP
jgi:S1-C subfamily serine protease